MNASHNELNAYAIFTISMLVLISMNLITTIIGYMAWKCKKDHIVVRTINRLGLFASFLVPISALCHHLFGKVRLRKLRSRDKPCTDLALLNIRSSQASIVLYVS